MSRSTEEIYNEFGSIKVPCPDNCDLCCSPVPWALSEWETIRKHKELFENLPPEYLETAQVRKNEDNEIVASRIREENGKNYLTCLFNAVGRCLVYEYRPVICRMYGTCKMFCCTEREGIVPDNPISNWQAARLIIEYWETTKALEGKHQKRVRIEDVISQFEESQKIVVDIANKDGKTAYCPKDEDWRKK